MIWNEGLTEYGMNSKNGGLPSDSLIQVWLTGDSKLGRPENHYVKEAVASGYRVVVSLHSQYYLDCG